MPNISLFFHVDIHAYSRTAKICVVDRNLILNNCGNYKLHGNSRLLPCQYKWVIPEQGDLDLLASALQDRNTIKITKSTSYLKIATSIAQLAWSVITLVRTSGSQFDRYGYAAFGLSILPYALMSLFNLIFVLVVGEYPFLSIMRTMISDEAKRQINGDQPQPVGVNRFSFGEVGSGPIESLPANSPESERCHGLVGQDDVVEAQLVLRDHKTLLQIISQPELTYELVEDRSMNTDVIFYVDSLTNCANPAWSQMRTDNCINIFKRLWSQIREYVRQSAETMGRFIKWIIALLSIITAPLLALVFPYGVIFWCTRFHKQESTIIERVSMMLWLSVSQISMIVFFMYTQANPRLSIFFFRVQCKDIIKVLGRVLLLLLFIPPVIGFVMVGKMLCACLPSK